MSGYQQRKIPKSLMEKVYDRWRRHGETCRDLAQEFSISETTMAKYLRQFEKGVVEEWR